jgi:hypothetical protein
MVAVLNSEPGKIIDNHQRATYNQKLRSYIVRLIK